jgi:hypothetical protein
MLKPREVFAKCRTCRREYSWIYDATEQSNLTLADQIHAAHKEVCTAPIVIKDIERHYE